MQDMGAENVYIFKFHAVFSIKISMITNVIDFIQQFKKKKKRDLHFRHHNACFCSISQTKKNTNS